jgi:hypothetical protein
MLNEIRTKLGMKTKASKPSKLSYDFVIGLADLLPHSAYQACYGIEWAIKTGRLPGAIEMTIRKLSAWDFAALVAEVVAAEVSQNDTPRWLIKRYG